MTTIFLAPTRKPSFHLKEGQFRTLSHTKEKISPAQASESLGFRLLQVDMKHPWDDSAFRCHATVDAIVLRLKKAALPFLAS